MKKLVLFIVLLCAAQILFAQGRRVRADIQNADEILNLPAIFQTEPALFDVYLYSDGSRWMDITNGNYGGFLMYGTNYEYSTSGVMVTGVASSVTNLMQFQFTAADSNTNGEFFGQIVITNSVTLRKYVWGNVNLTIKRSPFGAGTASPLVLLDMPTGVSQGDLAVYSTSSVDWVRLAPGLTGTNSWLDDNGITNEQVFLYGILRTWTTNSVAIP